MTNAETLIHVEGLKKHYNHGRIRALDGIDIDINKGDVMVVIGPSGSGKSTFLRRKWWWSSVPAAAGKVPSCAA